MISTLKAIAGRLRAAAGKHTLATGLSVSLAAAVAGIGGGYALADHANASPAAAAHPAAPAAAPTKGAKHKGSEVAKKLVGLVAQQIGQTPQQVIAALKGGQTLDQVAGSKAAAVVQAAEAAAKTKLDAMVTAGKLTSAEEATKLTRLASQISRLMAEPGSQVVASLRGHSGAPISPSPTP